MGVNNLPRVCRSLWLWASCWHPCASVTKQYNTPAMHRPGVEPATSWSRVQRPTTTLPSQKHHYPSVQQKGQATSITKASLLGIGLKNGPFKQKPKHTIKTAIDVRWNASVSVKWCWSNRAAVKSHVDSCNVTSRGRLEIHRASTSEQPSPRLFSLRHSRSSTCSHHISHTIAFVNDSRLKKSKDIDLYSASHVQDTSNAHLRHWNWAARPLFRSPHSLQAQPCAVTQ